MATQMVRKQMYITRNQEERLKRLAKEKSVSEAELLREALEEFLENQGKRQRSDAAWARIEESIHELEEKARKEAWPHYDSSKEGRGWTREELYEERLGRHA